MKTILKIQASLFGGNGESSRLADHFIEQLLKQHTEARVVTRDLDAQPVPQLTLERFQALAAQPEARTPAQQAVVDESDALIAELESADVIVLAVPMYNFNVPTALHNYFDHIARAGVTFRYTENGPEGLIRGKRVHVFATRGGQYGEEHSQTAFLRQFLAFIGLDDAKLVLAEGLAMGEEVREKSLAAARHEIAKLVRPFATAA